MRTEWWSLDQIACRSFCFVLIPELLTNRSGVPGHVAFICLSVDRSEPEFERNNCGGWRTWAMLAVSSTWVNPVSRWGLHCGVEDLLFLKSNLRISTYKEALQPCHRFGGLRLRIGAFVKSLRKADNVCGLSLLFRYSFTSPLKLASTILCTC